MKVTIPAIVLIVGFAAGWLSHAAYRPTVQHVVVDDIPFMSGSNLPKPTPPDCGTPDECRNAVTCDLLAYTDRKTGKLKYPRECADYFTKKRLKPATQRGQTTPKL